MNGQDVVPYEPRATVVPLRVSPEDAAKYARAFAASQMFSAGYNKATSDQIFTQIMVGAEYGFGPGASMVNLYVTDGVPELSANAQATFIKASGKYDYRITELTDKACEITVISLPSGEVIGVERYTWDDAERQELTGLTKRGNKTQWHKAPRNMLFARCISNVCAFHCPDVVPMRTYSPGETSGHEGEDLAAARKVLAAPDPVAEVVPYVDPNDPLDDVPFDVAPASPDSPAESPPLSTPGQIATGETAAEQPGTNGGGLITNLDDAQKFVRPLQHEQIAVMKQMLGIKGSTTKREMAALLLEQRAGWDPQDVLAEMGPA